MKNKKIWAGILAFILIGGILFIANGLIGNPLSKMLANRAAKKYVAQEYNDFDLQVEDAVYNFKDGRYYVDISSNRSVDTHFQINYDWAGKLVYDNYEDVVVSKWNTWQRLEREYNKLVDSKIEVQMELKERDFIFGSFINEDDFNFLEIDEVYDIRKLAKTLGVVTVHLEREERDAKIMAESLFEIKKIFDLAEIPFYHIDVDISEPRQEDKEKEDEKAEEQEYLMIREFAYKDIYLEGLEKRVEENIEETKIIYGIEDSKKQEEIDEFKEENK